MAHSIGSFIMRMWGIMGDENGVTNDFPRKMDASKKWR